MPLARCLRYIKAETREWAMVDALNRGGTTMRKVASKAIPAQAPTIKQAMVNKSTELIPASTGRLVATVKASDNWLHSFGSRAKLNARASKTSGASFTPWTSSVKIAHGFKATVANGFTSIFVRSTKARYPIVHVGFGPAVNREMVRSDKPAGQLILKSGAERFNVRVIDNVARVTKAGKARFGL